ncbi:MAG: MarR family transcriptional regulator [Leptospirales bacterium]|nr:MarR family transcriptional regulator [Leptospirales bacterium]
MTNRLSVKKTKERAWALVNLADEVLRLSISIKQMEKEIYGDEGMSENELAVFFDLFVLGPQTVPMLARSRGATRQRIQQIMDILLKRRLVEKKANPVHATSVFYALTGSGARKATGMSSRERRFFLKLPLDVNLRVLESSLTLLRQVRRAIQDKIA